MGSVTDRPAEMRDAQSRDANRIDAMVEIGRSLTAVHDLDELLRIVVRDVTQLLNADRSTIFLIDCDNSEVWSKVAQGANVEEIRLQLGQGVAGWVARTG